MTGSEFKRIREISGFIAREFAEYITMSPSYVYSLEQKYDETIPPRREEQFISFLGTGVYEKSRRIYELEQEAIRESRRKHAEEAPMREAKRLEELERKRQLKQEEFDAKRRQREEELEQRLQEMQAKKESGEEIVPVDKLTQLDSVALTSTSNQEQIIEDIQNISLSEASFDEKLDKFMELVERARKKKPEESSSSETNETDGTAMQQAEPEELQPE